MPKSKEPANMALKARAMMEGANKLAAEYLTEGRMSDAAAVYTAFGALSVRSLARLHDIITRNRVS